MKKRVRKVAEESLSRLEESQSGWLAAYFGRLAAVSLRDQIVATAEATRFWSVWFEVFADKPHMLKRFEEVRQK